METRIIELLEWSHETACQVIRLMGELSTRCTCTDESLRNVIADPASHLFCVMEGQRVVACATLCLFHSPTGTKGSVEDVVVAADCRGRHLGRQLMEHLMNVASADAPIELHLTSRPSRMAANRLYESLGFRQKETNCWVWSASQPHDDYLKQNPATL